MRIRRIDITPEDSLNLFNIIDYAAPITFSERNLQDFEIVITGAEEYLNILRKEIDLELKKEKEIEK